MKAILLLAALLSLNLSSRADDKAPAPPPSIPCEGPSLTMLGNLSRMSAGDIKKLIAFLKAHGEKLQGMTEAEIKTFMEDQAKLAGGKMTESNPDPAKGQLSPASRPRGPTEEDIARFRDATPEAQEKVRQFFRDNRDEMMAMTPDDHQNFAKQAINKILSTVPNSPLSIPIKDIDGKETTLGTTPAKAVLIVNVASACGYTNQYAGLQELYSKYKDKGLLVVGIPSNDFGGQEPGTEAEIKAFCTSNYSVTFPLYSKVSIPHHPLYAALIKEAGSVDWNFTKFLVTANGTKITKYEPDAEPNGEAIIAAIEAALAK